MKHHIWCNSQKEDATDCRYCLCLSERYPQYDGDTDETMGARYFPDTLKENSGEDWHRLQGAFYPDNCQVCSGDRGGIRGNENIVGGVIMCDYCSADDARKNEEPAKI